MVSKRVPSGSARALLLINFPHQKRLQDGSSFLRYNYIACLVITDMECVYCEVRTEFLYIIQVNLNVQE